MMASTSFPPAPGGTQAYHGPRRKQDPISQTSTRTPGPLSLALPKIAAGRSTLSAEKLWKDHSNIDIYTAVEKGRQNTPGEPPLHMSKNPKPLYRRSVPDVKPFRILHSDSSFGIRNTNSLPSLYAQMTFLANAVRNTDGTTSYKGMCQKRRSQTVPSSAPGRLQAADPTDLHWASAANDRPMPRILQPTSPRSNSNWNSPREGESPSGSPRKERASRGRVVRGPRSDSGIDSRASFLHTIAQKRGQTVVSYKHNGRQLYSLVNPPETNNPEHVRNQGTAKTTDISSGSSCITSSYATSFTDSSRSREGFSVKGIGQGIIRSPSAKDVKIISEVDVAQDTTQEGTSDGNNQQGHQEEVMHGAKLGGDPQEEENSTSQDINLKESESVVKTKGVHFAEGTEEGEDNLASSDEKAAKDNADKSDVDPINSDSTQNNSDSNQNKSDSNQVSFDLNRTNSELDKNSSHSNQDDSHSNQDDSHSNQDVLDFNQVDSNSNQPNSKLNQTDSELDLMPNMPQVAADEIAKESDVNTNDTAAGSPTSDTNVKTDDNPASPVSETTLKTDNSITLIKDKFRTNSEPGPGHSGGPSNKFEERQA